MNLQKTIKLWLEEVKMTRARKTHLCYYDCYRRISNIKELNYSLKEITNLDLQNILFNLNGYSKSTIHNTRIVLNRTMKYAVKNGYIKNNPITQLELPRKAPIKLVEALTKFQQEKIEKIAECDLLGYTVLFLLRTGLRIGELFNLKWSDFDSKRNTIKITASKTKAGEREVPLSAGARFIIELCKRNNKIEYIFTNTKGKKLTYSSIQKTFTRIKKESGIKEFSPHICRHSFATRMIERGVDYKALSMLLGHKSVAFTLQRYATADMDFLKSQIKLIDN